jgi:hypothetical protein
VADSFIETEHPLIVHDTIIYHQKDSETGLILGYVIKGYEEEEMLSLQQAIDYGVGEFMVSEGVWSIES